MSEAQNHFLYVYKQAGQAPSHWVKGFQIEIWPEKSNKTTMKDTKVVVFHDFFSEV